MSKTAPRPERPAAAPRAWQRMLSGRRLDLLDPQPGDVAIEDIAHGLARVARWNGQTHGAHAFSVAQHSVLVEEIAAAAAPDWGRPWRLAALLHDAPEYVIGDLISPFKAALGLDYKTFETRLQAAVHRAFGLPAELPDAVVKAIKQADRIAAWREATELAGFSRAEADLYFAHAAVLPAAPLVPLAAGEAQALFLARFRALSDA